GFKQAMRVAVGFDGTDVAALHQCGLEGLALDDIDAAVQADELGARAKCAVDADARADLLANGVELALQVDGGPGALLEADDELLVAVVGGCLEVQAIGICRLREQGRLHRRLLGWCNPACRDLFTRGRELAVCWCLYR